MAQLIKSQDGNTYYNPGVLVSVYVALEVDGTASIVGSTVTNQQIRLRTGFPTANAAQTALNAYVAQAGGAI